MSGDIGGRSKKLLLLVVAISLQSTAVLADNPSSSNDAAKAEANPSKSASNMSHEVFFICLAIAGTVLVSVFLFKLWQKKKREEQHARLLRLFEEDDELELELGLRD